MVQAANLECLQHWRGGIERRAARRGCHPLDQREQLLLHIGGRHCKKWILRLMGLQTKVVSSQQRAADVPW